QLGRLALSLWLDDTGEGKSSSAGCDPAGALIGPEAVCLRRGNQGSVDQEAAVELGRQLVAGWLPVDLIDRRSRIQERSVAIFQPVVGVADIATYFELDAGVDRAKVALPKDGG